MMLWVLWVGVYDVVGVDSVLIVALLQVFTFGRNAEGQLCSGNLLPQTTPTLVKGLAGKPMVWRSHTHFRPHPIMFMATPILTN